MGMLYIPKYIIFLNRKKGLMILESGFVFNLFLRRVLSPFYANPISNKITGKVYDTTPIQPLSIGRRAFFVEKDIPEYLTAETVDSLSDFKVKPIRQYKGFACNLDGYTDVADYLKENLGKSTIKNIRTRKRQLESRFNVVYKFYSGEIDKEHYDFLFDRFYHMLKNRFDEKKTYNRYLLDWKHYFEMIYPMLLKNEALLSVIYANDEPISISLEFCLEDICFGYIHGYDSNYHRYQLGDIRMVILLEWLIANKFRFFDTLMGETVFKAKWSNHIYNFHYDVFYKKNSISSLVRLNYLEFKLRFKQWLRDKGILGKWFKMDKFLYKRMAKKTKES